VIVIGLTGSIGMGKTATAKLFADEGVPVYDADAAVHALYAPGGGAVARVEAAFPGVVVEGGVDRAALAERVLTDPAALVRLEAIVHALVAADRARFLELQRRQGAQIVVLDVPLLFETGGEGQVDAIVVTTAPASVQRERVLGRGLAPDRFEAILARQTNDAEKRARADFVIETGEGLESARKQVQAVLAQLRP
jgi:dephospho-CoA kinase